MKYNALYLIQPAPALLERLTRTAEDVAAYLSEPRLWTKAEGGRTAWTADEHAAQLKLLFLLRLWTDYVLGASEDGRLKNLLTELLGEPPFETELFDRWWVAERFDGADENFEEVEQRLGAEQPDLLANSGLPRVATWPATLGGEIHP